MNAQQRALDVWARARGLHLWEQQTLPFPPPEYMSAAFEVGQILVNAGYCDIGTMGRVLALVRDGSFEQADCAVAFRVAEYRTRAANRNGGKEKP